MIWVIVAQNDECISANCEYPKKSMMADALPILVKLTKPHDVTCWKWIQLLHNVFTNSPFLSSSPDAPFLSFHLVVDSFKMLTDGPQGFHYSSPLPLPCTMTLSCLKHRRGRKAEWPAMLKPSWRGVCLLHPRANYMSLCKKRRPHSMNSPIQLFHPSL